MHTNIYIFGDSIAFGKYDSDGGGWAVWLAEFWKQDIWPKRTVSRPFYLLAGKII